MRGGLRTPLLPLRLLRVCVMPSRHVSTLLVCLSLELVWLGLCSAVGGSLCPVPCALCHVPCAQQQDRRTPTQSQLQTLRRVTCGVWCVLRHRAKEPRRLCLKASWPTSEVSSLNSTPCSNASLATPRLPITPRQITPRCWFGITSNSLMCYAPCAQTFRARQVLFSPSN